VPRSVFTAQAAEAAALAEQRLAAAGVTATSTVLSGLAREQVVAFAEAQQADVIVVGASSRPAVAARLLGSVPLAIVARSTRPVLVVPHPHETP
jgi:nucleotide-binding universal stress UspA family protein